MKTIQTAREKHLIYARVAHLLAFYVVPGRSRLVNDPSMRGHKLDTGQERAGAYTRKYRGTNRDVVEKLP